MDITERLRRLYDQHGTNYVREAADEIERLRTDLAAAQARECVMRDALNCIACWFEGAKVDRTFDEPGAAMTVRAALAATPPDDAALHERLRVERERCANVADEMFRVATGDDIAAAIRALSDEDAP